MSDLKRTEALAAGFERAGMGCDGMRHALTGLVTTRPAAGGEGGGATNDAILAELQAIRWLLTQLVLDASPEARRIRESMAKAEGGA